MGRTHQELIENKFEEHIEDYILNSGYIKGNPKDYDKEFAVDTTQLFKFLEDTQPEKLQKLKEYYPTDYKDKLLNRLHSELNSKGMIEVLRRGINIIPVGNIKLAYFKPNSNLNEDLIKLYNKNRFSITRQLIYSTKNNKSIDAVIFLNGLPIIAMELKNEFTNQNVFHSIRQFKEDRDPRELLFKFKKRILVFFAVDTSEIYMTTKLDGNKTFFIPFNKGNNKGKGNPPNPNGFKTAYLWEDILQKDTLSDILKRFTFIEKDEKTEKIIFPRYHQLDAIRKIQEDILENGGIGHNYLIQHSAGSGKTNTISWLAHRLSTIHDKNDNGIYNSVIVITDRVVLDRQLQDRIYQLEHKHGVVEKIDNNSTQLADALKHGTKIIITTLQKFPYVLEKIENLEKRNYAVIIDEAHSSTSGDMMGALRDSLSGATKEPEEDLEDKIAKEIEKRGKKDNISFFAFTATPKTKTIELFGRMGEDGKPKEFHLYSMRQAIEEGFILDVLENYTTYKTYYNITKIIEDNPEFDKSKASKAIARFVSLHPYNIAQKTEIMIEHFRKFTQPKIRGKAKAMVITGSRKQAIKYKLEFDEYIKKKGYDIKTIVAFSGTVEDGGIEYTEKNMNKFSEQELPKKFNSDEYHILIVANKYQTGFDQPLLHTMFVDKKLTGVKAVQTLSRLNRTHKDKTDTFILDFVNDIEEIQKSFIPYYEKTEIESTTDPNLIYDLKGELHKYGVYDNEDIDKFISIFYKNKKDKKDKEILNGLIDISVDRYNNLHEDRKEEFKKKTKKYIRLYSFISQIYPMGDNELYKLYIYLNYLSKKIKNSVLYSTIDIDDKVALSCYSIKKTFEGDASLKDNSEIVELPPAQFEGTGKREEQAEYLETIIDRINKMFGTNFDKSDQLFIEQIQIDSISNKNLAKKAKANSMEDFQLAYYKEFMSMLLNRRTKNERFFAKIIDDEKIKNQIIRELLPEIYKRLKETA